MEAIVLSWDGGLDLDRVLDRVACRACRGLGFFCFESTFFILIGFFCMEGCLLAGEIS